MEQGNRSDLTCDFCKSAPSEIRLANMASAFEAFAIEQSFQRLPRAMEADFDRVGVEAESRGNFAGGQFLDIAQQKNRG